MRTLINIKVEDDVKKQAKILASELGLSLSAVMNGLLKQFVRNKGVNLSLAPRMTKELEDYLDEIEDDIKNNRNLSPPMSTSKEIENYLDSPL